MLDPTRHLGKQADVILFIGMRPRDRVHMVANLDQRLCSRREFGARELDRQRFMSGGKELEQLDAIAEAIAHLQKRLLDRLARPGELVGGAPEQEVLIAQRSATNRRARRLLSALISSVAAVGNGKHNLIHHAAPLPRRAS
ncbi:hypothetical protein JQ596_32310 [Bradyrhizobium manausense]|uniref:hypothetical protein n=1 Tax=Bradyrhizobium TaxID=374 RepID=UPI001BA8CE5B|nr:MULTISPECIES: hypothetical protein [Bradyrhizobium]MBR0830224.1 hypothetical protein [Bradyrhizobium manausense]UVO31532.1 hypothetical protein KUF59_13225 [Bradyrhizobium arachidis]